MNGPNILWVQINDTLHPIYGFLATILELINVCKTIYYYSIYQNAQLPALSSPSQ